MANEKDIKKRQESGEPLQESEESGILEMPSITNLLRRKKLKITNSYDDGSKSAGNGGGDDETATIPGLSIGTNEIKSLGKQNSSQSGPDIPPPTPKISRPNIKNLSQENGETHEDPLIRAMHHLFQTKGFQSALYLKIHRSNDSTQLLPIFHADSHLGAKLNERRWAGMEWNPKNTPEIWSEFVEKGTLEIAEKAHHSMRALLGVRQPLWTNLVRVGPAHSCRGLLLVVSQVNPKPSIDEVLHLVNSASPGSKKTA